MAKRTRKQSKTKTGKKTTKKTGVVAQAPRGRSKKSSTAAAITGQGSTYVPKIVVTLSHDEIARRAFEIWQAKGRPIGQDEANWREAEEQLLSETHQGIGA